MFRVMSIVTPGIRVCSRGGKPPGNGRVCVLGAKAGEVFPDMGRDWGERRNIVGCVG